MIPKGVPREVRYYPMVLMTIFPIVRQNDVRSGTAPQGFENVLYPGPFRGKKPVSKSRNEDTKPPSPFSKKCGAPARFPFAGSLRRKHHPIYLHRAVLAQQLQDETAAADLDIIGVCAKT
jgi:hypothetical protein